MCPPRHVGRNIEAYSAGNKLTRRDALPNRGLRRAGSIDHKQLPLLNYFLRMELDGGRVSAQITGVSGIIIGPPRP
jgi:hypothetical protein